MSVLPNFDLLKIPMVDIMSRINGVVMRYEHTTIKDFDKFHSDIARIINPFLKDFGLEYTPWVVKTTKNNDESFVDHNDFHLILNNIDVLKLNLPDSNFSTVKGKAKAEVKKVYFCLPNEKISNQISLGAYLKHLILNKLSTDILNYQTSIERLKAELDKELELLNSKKMSLATCDKAFMFIIPQTVTE